MIEKTAESIYAPKDDTRKMGNFRASYPLDPDAIVSPVELKISKDKALKLALENSVGSGIVQAMVDGTVGSGLSLESTVSVNLLTINRKKIASNSQKIEELWNLWADNKEACDRYGEQTLGQMLRAAAFNAYATGDVLQYIGIHKWQGLYVPYVKFIDGRSVASQDYSNNSNETAGIRTDEKGRITGYILKTEKDIFDKKYISVDRYVKYPNSDLNRVQYNLVRTGVITPNQKRGRPILLPVMNDIAMMGKFTEAELVKAIIQSYITGFITRDKELISHGVSDTSGDALFNTLQQDARPDEVGDYERPITMGPGLINTLAPGEKIELAESKSPVAEFWKFLEGVLKMVSMGVGLPFEVVLQVFNSNYSASQAAIQAAARRWDIEREHLSAQFMTSLYELFVWLLVQQNIVNCPGYMDNPFTRAAWNHAQWHGPVILNIDPVKNATAATLRLNNMTSTFEDESRLWGKDFDKVVERRMQEKEMMEDAGLTADLTVEKKDVLEGENE